MGWDMAHSVQHDSKAKHVELNDSIFLSFVFTEEVVYM